MCACLRACVRVCVLCTRVCVCRCASVSACVCMPCVCMPTCVCLSVCMCVFLHLCMRAIVSVLFCILSTLLARYWSLKKDTKLHYCNLYSENNERL